MSLISLMKIKSSHKTNRERKEILNSNPEKSKHIKERKRKRKKTKRNKTAIKKSQKPSRH